MKKSVLILMTSLLLMSSNAFAQDVSIDRNGNLTTGSAGAGNLEVTGSSGEDGIVGLTDGTGAAGVHGENTSYGDYGKLGEYGYGVYGYSLEGYAGYFNGNARVTGNLTVDGTFQGNHDHDNSYVNEGQSDSVTSSMIVNGTIQEGDLSFSLGDGHSLDAADGIPADAVFVDNNGSVGVGTTTPAGTLDVNGDICLGSVCRTTWPTGSGTGAFTNGGASAYYSGGDVGIGTTAPLGLTGVDSRVLHMVHPAAPIGDTAVGLRLEVDGLVDGGILSAYRAGGEGGLFVGTLNDYHIGFGTKGIEQVTLVQNGNFGIGTETPFQRLHVHGSAYVSENLGIGINFPTHNLHVSGNDALLTSGGGDFRLMISKNVPANHSSIIFQDNFIGFAELGLTGDNNFHFKVSADGTAFSDSMMIDNTTGFIGIGTSHPESKLNIVSTTADIPFYIEDLAGSAFSMFVWKKGDGDAVSIRKQTGTGSALVVFQGTGDPAMVIKNSTSDILMVESSGNVGIGTTTPQGTLDVNGPIYQRGSVLHADYVFEPDYHLESIEEHADFMWQRKHLKGMPKAATDENGREIVEVGSHRRGIVEELEKAHIYIDQLHKRINEQNRHLKLLEERLAIIEARN